MSSDRNTTALSSFMTRPLSANVWQSRSSLHMLSSFAGMIWSIFFPVVMPTNLVGLREKFKYRRLGELLVSIYHAHPHGQRPVLERTIEQ
jgi:hypothetical protein